MESISTAELFLEKNIYLLMSIFHPEVSNDQLKFLEPPFVSDSSHSLEQERVVLGLFQPSFL